jgi:hypothetical protein
MKLRIALLGLAVAVLLPAAAQSHNRPPAQPTDPQMALEWNVNAVNAVRAATTTVDGPSRPLFQTEGLIFMAFVQAAVYNATVAIDGGYEPYGFSLFAPPGASADAAIAASAHDTLVNLLPSQKPSLDALYATSLAGIADGQSKTDGISVGQAAALGVQAIRTNDGRYAPTATYGTIGPVVPGGWQVVPPATSAQTPWIAFMHPFLLREASQFRSDPPPRVNGRRFARELEEVRLYGGRDSTPATTLLRTPEQTATALFWNANVINQENRVYRDVAIQHDMNRVDTVRLLAMAELVVADAGIACFDAKYEHLFWRPQTAVSFTGDADWLSLLNTPNHPEWPSAHGCVTGALARVLANALGTKHIDVDIWGAEGGAGTLSTMRHFDTVSDLDDEITDARVWIGFHYRSSVTEGIELARNVAEWTLKRYFRAIDD